MEKKETKCPVCCAKNSFDHFSTGKDIEASGWDGDDIISLGRVNVIACKECHNIVGEVWFD